MNQALLLVYTAVAGVIHLRAVRSKHFSEGRMKTYLLSGLLVLLLVISAGCGGGGATTGTTTATGKVVIISDLTFSPATLTIDAGNAVTWTNQEGIIHTVVSDTGLFESGSMVRNATFSHTFNTAGTYTYHCGLHPEMKGTVIVR